jgi:hypothetical protein
MKNLSPRRAAEFRGRHLRKVLGDRKQRAARFEMLVRKHGHAVAKAVSDRSERIGLMIKYDHEIKLIHHKHELVPQK